MPSPSKPDDPKSRLHARIAALTRSGETTLDAEAMREVKQLCRRDDGLLDLCHALLCHRLAEPHAQVRYSAFQVVDQLFRRSARFRALTLDRFERLVDSVLIGNEADTPPPKPASVFRQLGDLALEAFIDWHELFSREQPKLVFAFRYLSEAHSARLRQVRDRLAQAASAQRAEARRLAEKKRDLLADVGSQLAEELPELQACMATVANCLGLLVPSPAEFDVNPLTSAGVGDVIDCSEDRDEDGEEAPPTTADEQRRLHGIVSSTATATSGVVLALRLSRPSVRETPDNAELIEALVTRAGQLRRRMRPRLARWLAVAERCVDGEGDGESEGAQLRRQLTELLAEAERLLARVQDLRIVRLGDGTATSGCDADFFASDDGESTADDDDDDFEVVNKEGFETEAVAATMSKASPKPSKSSASTSKSSASTSKSSASTSKSSASTSKASSAATVVVPFGIDLANWGAVGSATIGYRPDDGGHAFGYRPPDGDAAFVIQGSQDMLSMRTILFPTADEPVRRACRHPLPESSGGGLCERRDRVKCPFHGRIVSRDEAGRPTTPDGAAAPPPSMVQSGSSPTKKRKANVTATSAAQSEVAASAGVSVGGGLVDIRSLVDTPRTRLAARVASKAALRRAAEDEAARRRRKVAEKFGDHFQYQYLN